MPVKTAVILNDFCHAQGGASRVAIDEAIALRAQGLQVVFLGAVGPVCDELRDGDVSVVCLGHPELADVARHPEAAIRAIWNQDAYRAMRAILAPLDRRQTIVHLHGYTKALSTTPAVVARGSGFATICTLHDFFAACPNGAFFNYRTAEPCPLRPLSTACLTTACDKRNMGHKAYRVLRTAAQRHIARFPARVHHYIVLSRRSATVLRPYLPRDALLHPLGNIIDVGHAPPVDPGANQTLMVVGRLDEEKGVMLASRAAAAAAMPIVFVGDGPYRARIEETGARVTGWLPAAEVQRELSGARCLVFPSLWYETFGLVVAEAAARGVPAIVSDISAAADRVTDGKTGWIFRSGDMEDLAARMALTRSNDAVRSTGAAAYQEYCASRADPARHARDLLGIYAEVLAAEVKVETASAWVDNASSARDVAPGSRSRQ